MHKHWKHFQNETAELPQNKFWKKVTNLINERSKQAVQPIYDKNNNLLWDDKEILNSVSNIHIKRNHVKNKYNFDDNFKQEIDKKVNDILHNIEISNPQHDSCQILNSPISLRNKVSNRKSKWKWISRSSNYQQQ